MAALVPHSVKGLLLVTPFARLAEVARLHYPFLPSFLLRDRYAPLDDLAAFRGPAVLLVAGRDEVVTRGQGERLYAALRGEKRILLEEGASHNGLDLRPDRPFWKEAVSFLVAGAP